jgi:aryl-alcohol dehydrogenase
MKAVAAITREPNAPFSLETVEIASPAPDEVRVRIHAVGICHTDLVFASGAMGSPFPIVLGHEGAGIVESVGEKVTKAAVGDKVLLTFDSCGHCPTCDSHDPAYCESFVPLNFAGVYGDGSSPLSQNGAPVSGRFFGQSSFANYAIASARNIVKLPVDADLAALAPLGCAVQTGAGAVMRSLAAKPGSSLVVIGGGAVGLSAVIGGVLAGCTTIILIEPQSERRTLGLSIGAHHALDPAASDTIAAVRAILPQGANNIVDTSGNDGALQSSIGMLAQKGKLGLIGVPGALDAVLPVPIVPALTLGFSVMGICEGDSDPEVFLPELVAHFAAGRLPIDKFTRTYPFDQINQAIDDAHHGKCVKAVLILDETQVPQ